MSFVERIIWQGMQRPAAPALSVSGRAQDIVTYGELNRYIGNLAQRLHALGVVPGALYGLHINDELLHIATALALEHLGAATAIVAKPEHVAGWPIAGMFVLGPRGEWTFPVQTIDADWLEGDRTYPLERTRRGAPDDLCYVICTSGSTGKPKGVPLNYRLSAMRTEQFDYRFSPEFARSGRLFCSMGLLSGWSYGLLNYTLARGGLFCLPGTSLDQTMFKFATYKLQSMVAPPLYLAELWQLSRRERRDFQSLQVIVSGGGMLRRALAENVRNTICNRLINYYGSSEAGGVAAGPVEQLDLERGEVGFIIPGVNADIVDPSSRTPLSEGVGTLRIRSERAARGYIGLDEDGERVFEGDAVYSGDQATLSPDGVLSIFGRNSNVVNLGGPKATLETIETHYAEAPGVAEAASLLAADQLGIDRLVAFVVPSDRWSERDFWNYCHSKVAPEYWPKQLIVVPSLPRVATGKVDRQKLPTLL